MSSSPNHSCPNLGCPRTFTSHQGLAQHFPHCPFAPGAPDSAVATAGNIQYGTTPERHSNTSDFDNGGGDCPICGHYFVRLSSHFHRSQRCQDGYYAANNVSHPLLLSPPPLDTVSFPLNPMLSTDDNNFDDFHDPPPSPPPPIHS